MCANYNINQTVIELSIAYVPEKGHVTHFINDLVESLKIKTPYIFGCPKEYDLACC